MAQTDDLENYTASELVDLRDRINTIIVKKHALEQNAIKERLITLATEAGFSIEEVLALNDKRRGKKGAIPAKFRNPANPSETWSGRGRKPNWLVERLKKRGSSIEDFAI